MSGRTHATAPRARRTARNSRKGPQCLAAESPSSFRGGCVGADRGMARSQRGAMVKRVATLEKIAIILRIARKRLRRSRDTITSRKCLLWNKGHSGSFGCVLFGVGRAACSSVSHCHNCRNRGNRSVWSNDPDYDLRAGQEPRRVSRCSRPAHRTGRLRPLRP